MNEVCALEKRPQGGALPLLSCEVTAMAVFSVEGGMH